jgi:hypothetical protein
MRQGAQRVSTTRASCEKKAEGEEIPQRVKEKTTINYSKKLLSPKYGRKREALWQNIKVLE